MSYGYKSINNHAFSFRMKDLPVFFTDMSCMDIIKAVLDEEGNIKNFPGITDDERHKEKQRVKIHHDVRYEAHFISLEDNTFLMKWIVQPNGWYWVDEDGFGFSGNSSIMMYSVIDGNGVFLKPFELFSIDNEIYCHESGR